MNKSKPTMFATIDVNEEATDSAEKPAVKSNKSSLSSTLSKAIKSVSLRAVEFLSLVQTQDRPRGTKTCQESKNPSLQIDTISARVEAVS